MTPAGFAHVQRHCQLQLLMDVTPCSACCVLLIISRSYGCHLHSMCACEHKLVDPCSSSIELSGILQQGGDKASGCKRHIAAEKGQCFWSKCLLNSILLIFRVGLVGSYSCWFCTHHCVEDKGCFGACATLDASPATEAGWKLLEASGIDTHTQCVGCTTLDQGLGWSISKPDQPGAQRHTTLTANYQPLARLAKACNLLLLLLLLQACMVKFSPTLYLWVPVGWLA